MTSIVYVLRSYPRSSQTFVLNEIHSLEKRGIDVSVVAMSKAADSVHQPIVDQIKAPITYLRESQSWLQRMSSVARAIAVQPVRVGPVAWSVLMARKVDRGYTAAGRLACLVHALELSKILADRPGAVHLHAHFAHDPAYVAMLTRRLTRVTYSFTGHARDLYQIDPDLLAERVEEAEFVTTVTEHNARVIDKAAPKSTTPVHVIPQGTNASVFSPLDHSDETRPLALLAVGRLVPKKGFDVLIEACRILVDAGADFHCTIFGEGPESSELQEAIVSYNIAEYVSLLPPVEQHSLPEQYRKCDLFVLPAVVTSDGDSDALPTVLLEAMSCGRPVVTTAVGGIAELVTDGVNGRLVEPGDATALAVAIAELTVDEPERMAMGVAARETILDRFDHEASVTELAGLLCFGLPPVVNLDRFRDSTRFDNRLPKGKRNGTGAQ